MVSSVSGSNDRPSSPYAEAQSVEADAQRRIQNAEEQVVKVRQSTEQEAQAVRDGLETQANRQSEAQKLRLALQEQENYENLRHLKNKYQAESSRLQNLGEKENQRTKEYYERAATQEAQRGQRELRETQKHNMMSIDGENRGALEREMFYRQDQANRVKSLEERKLGIQQASEKEQALIKRRTDLEVENQSLHHQERLDAFQLKLQEQQDQLIQAQDETNRRFQAVLQASELALSQYDSVKEDPFYRPLNIGAEVKEDGDFYVLTARIPEHERETIKVTGSLNEIVLTGTRKSNVTLQDDDGSRKTTSSYQTFNQIFPTESPIDPATIRKSFEGERMTAWIPKAGTDAHRQIKAEAKVKSFDLGMGPKPLLPHDTIASSRKPVKTLES